MITTELRGWTNRVLEPGGLGAFSAAPWKLRAYEQYKEKLSEPIYPCFFGQTAEARGEMLYTFVAHNCLDELVTNMRRFVSLTGTVGHERSSLIAFFEPDPAVTDHASFVTRFWQVLQFLHNHDHISSSSRGPDHPLWEFSFEGSDMFVVGASPTYRNRRSRNLGPGIVLVFQPRFLFIDPATLEPIAAPVRQRIHKRMLAYDGMPVHPDIGFYGDSRNREWKQYALPDDNEPEIGSCPFHTKRDERSARGRG